VRARPAFTLALAAALLVAGGCGHKPPAGVRVVKDVVYYRGPAYDDHKHRLDLYLPRGRHGFPVVVFIHGGSWRMGDRGGPTNPYYIIGERLAARGVGVAVASYRLAPGTGYRGQAEDVARAFAWTYRNAARWRGDPARVYLMGHSAGAHLAALVALDRRYLAARGVGAGAVAGVIGLSGPYDISYCWAAAPWLSRRWQLAPTFGTDAASHAAASATNYVRADAPPFLLFNAAREQPHFREQAERLARGLRRAGARAEVVGLPRKSHYTEMLSVGAEGEATTAAILAFVGG